MTLRNPALDGHGRDGAVALPDRSVEPTAAGQVALDTAQALARKAAAPATLRAYKADWTHFAGWCAEHGFGSVRNLGQFACRSWVDQPG